MIKYTELGKLAPALLAAQKSMGDAVKNSKNPFFKSSYADLNSIREAVIPALNANGITLLQPTHAGSVETGPYVETVLLHDSGEYLSSTTPITCAKQHDPQALGSAISYARRYGLQSLLSIGAVDDDGESAMQRAPAPAPKKATPPFSPEAAVALAQTVVARKKSSKESLLLFLETEYGVKGDSISEIIHGLSAPECECLNNDLKEMLNGK